MRAGQDACPCGSGAAFAACCEPYLAGWEPAPTAEALMRSRYTAYARGDVDYLVATHAPETRAPDLAARVAAWARAARFTRLEVVAREAGGPDDATGAVTFVAHFEEGGAAHAMTERSRFRKDPDGWRYVDGVTPPSVRAAPSSPPGPREREPGGAPKARGAQIGRNDPCPCGSGKKHKQCCGR